MDEHVPHQDAHEQVIDERLEDASDVTALADHAAAAGANPTKAEYDALVVKFNKVLEVLRDADLIPSA